MAVTDSLIAPDLMIRYSQLIYDVTGIRIPSQKQALLTNRVRRRLKGTGIDSFEEYFGFLQKLKPSHPEWDHFLQEVTTHETYLFRDEPQWTWLQNEYLPEVSAAAERGQRPRSLRIWSAACSTGDEAYTAAICLLSGLKSSDDWSLRILGTDIGIGAIAQARQPVFGSRSMRLVPRGVRLRYFMPTPDEETFRPRPEMTALMQFRQHNLLDPLLEQPFDLIILKNVLIYFDDASKKRVVTKVLRLLKPGSYLIAGAAEGIADQLKKLKRLHAWLYRYE